MKLSLIVQFGINLLLVCLVWFGGVELELRGLISTKSHNIAGIAVWAGSILYWFLTYAYQEKWWSKFMNFIKKCLS